MFELSSPNNLFKFTLKSDFHRYFSPITVKLIRLSNTLFSTLSQVQVLPIITLIVLRSQFIESKSEKNKSSGAMGSCTSTPNTPIGMPIEENTFRIRQLDNRLRKKAGMVLRLTNDTLIIEQRGKRHKPELSASV